MDRLKMENESTRKHPRRQTELRKLYGEKIMHGRSCSKNGQRTKKKRWKKLNTAVKCKKKLKKHGKGLCGLTGRQQKKQETFTCSSQE
jgi:hypothetical protein